MTDRRPPTPPLDRAVAARVERKLKARRAPRHAAWSGFGMMGVVGWSVVVPTLLGALLGMWLDAHHPGRSSWTLALLVAGLTLGCINAWRWIAQEDRAMREQQEDDHE